MARKTGIYEESSVAGETVAAFVPHALPPREPELTLPPETRDLLSQAERAVARLDAAGRMVPSLEWFVYAFVRKEAVITSQIEGTQASLADLLEAEADVATDAPPDDVEEICNYLEALTYARRQLAMPRGLPLSLRLLNGAHKRLLGGARGRQKQPGMVRRSQNWIGGTRPGNAAFVPPPPHRLDALLADLEQYLHRDDGLPPLARAGLVHAQFETIHPYLDGNGRVGRLLIALCLEDWQVLSAPLLYLSLFFKRHRQEYYDRLSGIRTHGDWEGWVAYFLEAVRVIAEEASDLVRDLFDLVERDRRRLTDAAGATVPSLRLFELLPRQPVVTPKLTAARLQVSLPTAAKAIAVLEENGVLEETSGRERGRRYRYAGYVELLRVGTEL